MPFSTSSAEQLQVGPEQLIVNFGEASLLKRIGGNYFLRGGSETDRKEALEWIARILPEALLDICGR